MAVAKVPTEPKFNYLTTGISTIANRKKQYIDFYSTTHDYGVAFVAFLTRLSLGWEVGTEEFSGFGTDNPAYVRQNGVRRKIDIGFQVPSDSTTNAEYNLQKLGFLAKLIHPTYELVEHNMSIQNIQYTDAIYHEDAEFTVTFGNLVQAGAAVGGGAVASSVSDLKDGASCVIKDLSYEFDLDAGFIEGSKPRTRTADGSFYPKLVNVNLELIILNSGDVHGWDTKGNEIGSFKNYPFGAATTKARGRSVYSRSGVVQESGDPSAMSTSRPSGTDKPVAPITSTPEVDDQGRPVVEIGSSRGRDRRTDSTLTGNTTFEDP